MKKAATIVLVLLLFLSCESLMVNLFFTDSLLIDMGYRTEMDVADRSPVFVIGENIKKIDTQIKRQSYKDKKSYFQALGEHFRESLIVWDKKFPGQKRTEILEKYGNRNSENVIHDGFYYGCADICALVGSVLIQNGYDCKLIYTVSAEFTANKNFGHVYLFIAREEKTFLFDPAMSREVIANYSLGTRQVKVKSIIGDQFIYAVHDQPGQIRMIDRETERNMRKAAIAEWNK